MQKPLAEILRPKSIATFIGQEHLMGEGAVLRTAIEHDSIHSMILWGPPGVGKTTLALLIAELTGSQFFMLSAISSGVKDIREIIEKAKALPEKSILFIDEIHRFSKAQQDSLLGAVEQGIVTLIGATTENPSFEVIAPLLSRCQVYILKSLDKVHLEQIIVIAKDYLEKQMQVTINIEDTEALMRISGGDARKLINAIELVTGALPSPDGVMHVTNDNVQQIIQKNLAIYDKKGEQHYDIISAFIKSVRGSDPNAAVYWMARMLSGGEDPLFIARRMIILASEDIGNANPNALLLANNCFQAVHHIGMPEARIVLAQTAIYLASSPKSNASYLAIDEALAWVKKCGDLPVPLALRNAPTELMKDIGYSDGYKYSHDYDHNFAEQEFLPTNISGKKFYEPQPNARENELRRYLKNCWKNKYNYIILIVVSLLCFRPGYAQDIHYSQFYTTALNMNPANAGAFDGVFRIGVNQKTQWLSVTKPYVTFSGSIDAPIIKDNKRQQLLGLGLHVNADKAGDAGYSSFQALLSASYIKSIGRKKKHKIGIGLSAGLVQRSIDYSALTFDEQFLNGIFSAGAPVSEDFENNNVIFFDCAAGVFWRFTVNKNQFSFGSSVAHLNRPNEAMRNHTAPLPIISKTYFVSKIEVGRHVVMMPMGYCSFQKKYREIVFGTTAEYLFRKNSYTVDFALGGGLFYRWDDALTASLIFEWQNLRFDFGYDINLSRFVVATRGRGGFEVSLVYIFKKKTIGKIGKEPCPYDIM